MFVRVSCVVFVIVVGTESTHFGTKVRVVDVRLKATELCSSVRHRILCQLYQQQTTDGETIFHGSDSKGFAAGVGEADARNRQSIQSRGEPHS